MEDKDIEKIIKFHQDGLDQYHYQMSPSAQVLTEQTIEALEELRGLKSGILCISTVGTGEGRMP
jgi:mevalonate pyrophosphate decarboxylase